MIEFKRNYLHTKNKDALLATALPNIWLSICTSKCWFRISTHHCFSQKLNIYGRGYFVRSEVSFSWDLCVYFDTITLAFLAFQPKHTASASAAISEEFYAKVSDSKISSKLARWHIWSRAFLYCTVLLSEPKYIMAVDRFLQYFGIFKLQYIVQFVVVIAIATCVFEFWNCFVVMFLLIL